jgi:pyruvate/2-oxoglutarate dehydrogenase complex dihydrolipoamide acyltransferase (E2) component
VVVSIAHAPGAQVVPGAPLVVLEAMKMEHEVLAESAGVLDSVEVAIGESVEEGQVLALIGANAAAAPALSSQTVVAASEDGFRADLEAVRERHAVGLERRARTSANCSTRAPTWSTARCCSPRRRPGARARS